TVIVISSPTLNPSVSFRSSLSVIIGACGSLSSSSHPESVISNASERNVSNEYSVRLITNAFLFPVRVLCKLGIKGQVFFGKRPQVVFRFIERFDDSLIGDDVSAGSL